MGGQEEIENEFMKMVIKDEKSFSGRRVVSRLIHYNRIIRPLTSFGMMLCVISARLYVCIYFV
jgi:hypothetical protein